MSKTYSGSTLCYKANNGQSFIEWRESIECTMAMKLATCVLVGRQQKNEESPLLKNSKPQKIPVQSATVSLSWLAG